MLPNFSGRVVRGVDAAFVVTTLDPFNPMQISDLGKPWTDGEFDKWKSGVNGVVETWLQKDHKTKAFFIEVFHSMSNNMVVPFGYAPAESGSANDAIDKILGDRAVLVAEKSHLIWELASD
jgi:hypothetical protein